MSGYRPERVAEQIHKEVAQILMYNIKDPRVASVTLTGVKMSRDLSVARLFFTLADSEGRAEAERGLKSAAPYIRRELGQVMQLRFVPVIVFQFDQSITQGQRIDDLLRQVRQDDSDA